MSKSRELVGLLPAAGLATRLGDLAGSKEAQLVLDGDGRAVPAASAALAQMRAAGVARTYVVLRDGKQDVRAALADEEGLTFLGTPGTSCVPETLDVAYESTRGATVALAWPDVIYRPADALARTVQGLGAEDVCLGLFPTLEMSRFEQVVRDAGGAVREILGGASDDGPGVTWALAAWGPTFTEFLHADLARRARAAPLGRELLVREILNAALAAGLTITTVEFPGGGFHDIGTPQGLDRARRGEY